MLRSIEFAACLAAAASMGCDGSPPPRATGWLPLAPAETARAAAILAGANPLDIDAESIGGLALQAVTAWAASPRGLVVGGVSPADDLFWDAWFVPDDGSAPRRLAPVDNLVSVDAAGALFTTIVSEDESGNAAYEVRLSPADGSPSVLLSPDLPPTFAAERVVTDGDGGRFLIGTETPDVGRRRAAVFAVAANGRARRIATDPGPDAALVVNAALAPEGLYVEVLYGAAGPSTIVRVPRPFCDSDLTSGAARGP